MHNAALEATGLDFVYVAFAVPPEGAQAVGTAMRTLNIRGLNVTVPHKQAVMARLDEVSPEAQAIGAVNTIDHRDGRLCGHNTDAHGFIASVREDGGLQRLPRKVVLLGAGGAARAILYALLAAAEVEHIALLNRTAARAETMAEDLDAGGRVTVGALQDKASLTEAELVINATSIGLYPDVDARLEMAIQTMSVRDAAAMVAEACGVPRRTVYARALELTSSWRGGCDG